MAWAWILCATRRQTLCLHSPVTLRQLRYLTITTGAEESYLTAIFEGLCSFEVFEFSLGHCKRWLLFNPFRKHLRSYELTPYRNFSVFAPHLYSLWYSRWIIHLPLGAKYIPSANSASQLHLSSPSCRSMLCFLAVTSTTTLLRSPQVLLVKSS